MNYPECKDCHRYHSEVEGTYSCSCMDARDCLGYLKKNCTCKDCTANQQCEFAYDAYNLQGDCIMLK